LELFQTLEDLIQKSLLLRQQFDPSKIPQQGNEVENKNALYALII